MNIVGLDTPFARLVSLLAAGGLCAALTGCGTGSNGTFPGGGGGGWNGEGASSGGDNSPNGPGGGTDAASSRGSKPIADASVAREASAEGAATGGDAGSAEDAGSPLITFTLIDTNVNTLPDGEPVSGYDPIPEMSTINLAQVGTALSIRANTTPAIVGSVLFVLDGTYTHTELAAPYTLCSDNGQGLITNCNLTVGVHTLAATEYLATDAGVTADSGATVGGTATLHFTIVDTAADGGAGDAGYSDGGGVIIQPI